MSVPSFEFFLFALVAAGIYNIVPVGAARRLVLLVANFAFLATFAATGYDLIPYAAFLTIGYLFIRGCAPIQTAWAFWFTVGATILLFCWLKKYTFLPEESFLHMVYVQVGLSYVFFRVLHLVVDAHSDERLQKLSLISYLNFTLNFTALVSGPIQRYEDYVDTTETRPRPLDMAVLGEVLERLVIGCFKVWAAAAIVAELQHALEFQVVEAPGLFTRIFCAAGLAALFPIFLFYNFSGYTDVVIAIARLFRIELPENFNKPFTAASFIDYWNRWHMSLSNWLKTYVYTPLFASIMRNVKNPKLLAYASAVSLFATFFLIGAWHGRTSEFFFFGFLNGLGVAVNQIYRTILQEKMGRKPFAALSARPLYLFVGRGLTFTWVAFTLLWFWSDWAQLAEIARGIGFGGVVAAALILILASCVALQVLISVDGLLRGPKLDGRPLVLSRYARTVFVTLLVMGVVTVQSVMTSPAPDIVYKDF
ncbi:UNVERIFIED_ORG: D-alanyl-lipoteichoic acid acyltransferase DltB (MBOAT superfamily) [Xanthobacter viscosus]|uniref:Probable alginate O-acetylase AlgI n=1 Tax=Xanthobacter autotrophicus TaxID=280 RepID=A0A6C1K9G3_XANAU|nr:MBOAT family O-acyltransferase [Xanthobacter autotrophicus]TLX40790.1 hypothetical protein FBQ73_22390 [Xanthobacter autotrophicus]